MHGIQSGYPLHFHRTICSKNSDYEQIIQLFQSYLSQPNSSYQLPQDIDEFAGRTSEINRVMALVEQGIRHDQSFPSVIAISGQIGVGKSALAIHLAHRLKSTFSDVQLYVDLHGSESQSGLEQRTVTVYQILAEILRSQGFSDSEIPTDEAGRAQLFQKFLLDKQAILVLDNAAHPSELISLIPKQGMSLVLIISRQPIQLENATALELAELPEIEAINLLHQFVTWDVLQLAPTVVEEIVNLCGRLPLPIHLIAGAIKHQSSKTLLDYANHLHQEYQRTKQLGLSYPEIRPAFTLSYHQLDTKSAQLLRRLGLLSSVHFNLSLASMLLEAGLNETSQAIGQLADLRLIARVGGGHYRVIHDVIRLLARGQLAGEESAEVRRATRLRICQWYAEAAAVMQLGLDSQSRLRMAQIISSAKRQPIAKVEQQVLLSTLHWFELAYPDLINAVEWAFQAKAWEIVIRLAENLVIFFDCFNYWQDWQQTHQLAIEAARQLGDLSQEAQLWNNLANGYVRQQQFSQARDAYKRSITLFQQIDDHLLDDQLHLAKTLANFGILLMQQGQYQEAINLWQDALIQLSDTPSEQQQLQQWMQQINPLLGQKMAHEATPQLSTGGLFGAVGRVIKRLMAE